jgi:hypothetical protein
MNGISEIDINRDTVLTQNHYLSLSSYICELTFHYFSASKLKGKLTFIYHALNGNGCGCACSLCLVWESLGLGK